MPGTGWGLSSWQLHFYSVSLSCFCLWSTWLRSALRALTFSGLGDPMPMSYSPALPRCLLVSCLVEGAVGNSELGLTWSLTLSGSLRLGERGGGGRGWEVPVTPAVAYWRLSLLWHRVPCCNLMCYGLSRRATSNSVSPSRARQGPFLIHCCIPSVQHRAWIIHSCVSSAKCLLRTCHVAGTGGDAVMNKAYLWSLIPLTLHFT